MATILQINHTGSLREVVSRARASLPTAAGPSKSSPSLVGSVALDSGAFALATAEFGGGVSALRALSLRQSRVLTQLWFDSSPRPSG